MHILILGTRGVPAGHGGFETFAQDLALFLTARNHKVTVYCQSDKEKSLREDVWKGVRRVLIPAGTGALGTVKFDWASVRHACHEDGVILTLGYNTGVFNYMLRWFGKPTVMNMDGIEWKRDKWSFPHRAWLWFNELAGAGASSHLVADHPEISLHLQRHTAPSKITYIPYGAPVLSSAFSEPVKALGLTPKNYYLVIARPEPDNSILEIVRAYSSRSRDAALAVVGKYSPETHDYHRSVLGAASSGVLFLGAIYDREILEPLRFHAKAYMHGHRVGGTNPSLVESLGAGNAIIAHENAFTRWVAGENAKYFSGAEDLASILDSIESDPGQLFEMEAASRLRHAEEYLPERVLSAYEALLVRVGKQSNEKASTPSASRVAGIEERSAYQSAYERISPRLATRFISAEGKTDERI